LVLAKTLDAVFDKKCVPVLVRRDTSIAIAVVFSVQLGEKHKIGVAFSE
jgi:hypothetical protein